MKDAIQTFHLRGALDYKKIGIFNKLMMKRMNLAEADFVTKEQIRPLLEALGSSTKQVTANTKIYDTPRLTIETRHVHLPNGKDRNYLFVQPGHAFCILPTDETYVYLIRQYRPVIDQYILEVPAGAMDKPGESRLACAKRELAEEARFSAK